MFINCLQKRERAWCLVFLWGIILIPWTETILLDFLKFNSEDCALENGIILSVEGCLQTRF